MPYKFVTSVAEAIRNIEAFNRDIANRGSLSPEEDRDLQILIARTELWALYRDQQGRWHAGPSKYIMLENVSPAVYTKIRRGVNSGNAATHLRTWLPQRPVERSHPGWQEVEAIAKAHTIGGHAQSDSVAFVLLDAWVNSGTMKAGDNVEPRAENGPVSDLKRSVPMLSEIEEQEVNLMVALARAMRPEVRDIALRELAAV
jgi:hypothetical protein